MTTIALDADRLRELDEDTRRAWAAYAESLRELAGDDYTVAEDEAWNALQATLQGLEERRRGLVARLD